MEIRLLESAKEDLKSGYRFYELQSAGLGEYFLNSVQGDVKSLCIYAGVHALTDGFYRMLAKRFPFAVYYLTERDAVNIYAIIGCRRDPNWISSRLASVRKRGGGPVS